MSPITNKSDPRLHYRGKGDDPRFDRIGARIDEMLAHAKARGPKAEESLQHCFAVLCGRSDAPIEGSHLLMWDLAPLSLSFAWKGMVGCLYFHAPSGEWSLNT